MLRRCVRCRVRRWTVEAAVAAAQAEISAAQRDAQIGGRYTRYHLNRHRYLAQVFLRLAAHPALAGFFILSQSGERTER
jgi:hypothetical protein